LSLHSLANASLFDLGKRKRGAPTAKRRKSKNTCGMKGCKRPIVATAARGAISAFCIEHSPTLDPESPTRDPLYSQLIAGFDNTIDVASAIAVTCTAPNCVTPVVRNSQFFPACRKKCQDVLAAMASAPGSFNDQLDALGVHHAKGSIQDQSWESYATGIRMWMRFRLGVQQRHPSQIDGTHPDGSPKLEADAEQQLIRFVEWLGFSGTLAPAQRAGYVSAVKAAHLLWFGFPYASISQHKFFRLASVLSGLIKSYQGTKSVLREGMLRKHFVAIFHFIDDAFKEDRDIYHVRPMEALLITMWQGIFRPDECCVTERNPRWPHMGQVVFRNGSGAPVPYNTPYQQINYCEYDPDGRKNDAGRTNPPVILAADHSIDHRRFSACFQLHSLFNLVKPEVENLTLTPLFPVNARGPIFSPFTYDALGKLVRRVMGWALKCNEQDTLLKPYTAYSLRIGGAVALHDAGADGLVIAAMGQWRSDVYQIYIRTARHKAMSWSIRMSRGLQAKL
jgi:hypothetical protein